MHPLGTPNTATTNTPNGLPAPSGVRGWLLLLCLMLTVVGPLISIALATSEYEQFAPHFVDSRGVQAAIFFSITLTACAVAFGFYAGLQLWRVQPGAVKLAKAALLFGLAADITSALIQTSAWPGASVDAQMLHDARISLIPSLIFFTLCFAYLNKSARVQATYLS